MCIFSEQASWREGNAGNYVYKNGTLEFFNHAEGIVEHEADGYKYVYQFKDHLGNIRLSYKDADGNGSITQSEIVQEKNYYPFGLEHQGYNFAVNGRKHDYKFQGVEFNEDLGLNLYEMDFRQYDPAIARFTLIDPLTEERDWLTPYNFVQNNPILRIDPTGLLDTYGVDGNGNITHLDNKKYYDENGNEVDKLVALDKKGNKTDKSVDVEKNVLNGIIEDTDSKGRSYDSFFAKNNENTLELFEFLATETNVEWSKVSENNFSWITTSHSTDSEYGGSDTLSGLLEDGKGDGNTYEHIHSHPKEGGIPGHSGPSGFHKKDLRYGKGDKAFAKDINTRYKNEFIKLRVYDAKTKEYILYDQRGSINRKKKL